VGEEEEGVEEKEDEEEGVEERRIRKREWGRRRRMRCRGGLE
jgi:hypothetical protein